MECGIITEDNFGCKKFIIFKSWKKVTVKCVANFFFVLGSYTLQQLVHITFKFKTFLQKFCAPVCVACSTVGQHAWLICVDCEQKPHELYPPELQWLVASWGFFLYKCSQSDQTVYTTCKSTFLLAVPFQTPYEISFTLQPQTWTHETRAWI
jgi:hypothetical protein